MEVMHSVLGHANSALRRVCLVASPSATTESERSSVPASSSWRGDAELAGTLAQRACERYAALTVVVVAGVAPVVYTVVRMTAAPHRKSIIELARQLCKSSSGHTQGGGRSSSRVSADVNSQAVIGSNVFMECDDDDDGSDGGSGAANHRDSSTRPAGTGSEHPNTAHQDGKDASGSPSMVAATRVSESVYRLYASAQPPGQGQRQDDSSGVAELYTPSAIVRILQRALDARGERDSVFAARCAAAAAGEVVRAWCRLAKVALASELALLAAQLVLCGLVDGGCSLCGGPVLVAPPSTVAAAVVPSTVFGLCDFMASAPGPVVRRSRVLRSLSRATRILWCPAIHCTNPLWWSAPGAASAVWASLTPAGCGVALAGYWMPGNVAAAAGKGLLIAYRVSVAGETVEEADPTAPLLAGQLKRAGAPAKAAPAASSAPPTRAQTARAALTAAAVTLARRTIGGAAWGLLLWATLAGVEKVSPEDAVTSTTRRAHINELVFTLYWMMAEISLYMAT